ncbi:MAG: hypothetical protein KY476_25765, partial [Planctomycetes bacterium]|nr:hypothetical protein [Planctomycetota bacterium]
MLALLSRLRRLFARHWGALLILLAIAGASAAILLIPAVHVRAASVWDRALSWTGLGAGDQADEQTYWCPMH